MFCHFEVMSENEKRRALINRPTKHDLFQKYLVRKTRGIVVMLDGIVDYGNNPPTWEPKEFKITGRDCVKFSGAIIFDDIHNMQEK